MDGVLPAARRARIADRAGVDAALDQLQTQRVVGAMPITATAQKIRRLMHYGQVMQSNALHFFHLSSPDLLFGFDSEDNRRNIVGVAERHPDIARKGVALRKFGQEVIRATAGKRVHGTGSVPGGVNKHVNATDHTLLKGEAAQMLAYARAAVGIAKELHWFSPWSKVLDWNYPWAKWFVGATCNIAYNCLDRHVQTWRKNKVAVIWVGEEGQERILTYGELYRQVNKCANGLKSLNKGRVVILVFEKSIHR